MYDVHAHDKPSRQRLDELAAYFDAVDAGDLPWDEASDVEIIRGEVEVVPLRLPREDLSEIQRRASRLGVQPDTIVRMLVRRYLDDPLTGEIAPGSSAPGP